MDFGGERRRMRGRTMLRPLFTLVQIDVIDRILLDIANDDTVSAKLLRCREMDGDAVEKYESKLRND